LNKLISLFGALALAGAVTGCSPERDRTGQIFVVTQGGANVKMGLVGVHVVTAEQLRPIAAKLVQEYKEAAAKRKSLVAVSLLDQSALKQFETELDAMEPARLAGKVDEIRLLKREADERLEKLKTEEGTKARRQNKLTRFIYCGLGGYAAGGHDREDQCKISFARAIYG
jgi:hypothetical protein